MTKFKKIVSGTLAGCLMASALMMSAGAANVQTTVISKAGVQAAAQTYSNTVALNSGMASQIVALPVYSGFSVCDLKVNNKAQGHVTVSIHEGSPTGALACSAFRVEAGESKSFAGVALTDGVRTDDERRRSKCADLYTVGYGAGSCTEYGADPHRRKNQSAERGHLCRGHSGHLPERGRQDGLHGAELQRLDLHAAAHGWPLDGQKYLVGQCIAHGVPVRYYGKVLSVCG